MTGILADNDVAGQMAILVRLWHSDLWQEIWTALNIPVLTFEDLGLARDVSDAILWRACQDRQVLLITGNRNDEGPDSLETTIRTQNAPTCLPVFTIADPDRIHQSKAYAERVAEQLLEYLLEIDKVRGTGRLYVP